ncbi:MAG TPA: hypothetical protein VN256_06105 [Pyrinomonadaceae bacterium]|nr:hypothetical protein [Pyrinomonadaceae bacterium]
MDSLIERFGRMEKGMRQLLDGLRTLTEEQLIQVIANAGRMEAYFFLARGMCVLELRSRIKDRLNGGRGKRDYAGEGINAQTMRLAETTGINISTLNTDARICEVFFTAGGETTLARESLLPREYYVIALGAPDPHAAIRIAVKQSADPHYRRERFRAYVRGLKRIENNSTCARRKSSILLRAYIPEEVDCLLSEILELTGKEKAQILAEAITSFHRTIKTRKPGKSRERAQLPQSQPGDIQDGRQLSLGI